MPALSIFSAPTAVNRSQTTPRRAALKRKRRGPDAHSDEIQSPQRTSVSQNEPSQSVEYAAVVTPVERSQRRLAGWPLDQEPPSLPFPHARPSSKNNKEVSGVQDEPVNARSNQSKQSLHSQHLSAMTALLHRCVMTEDYARAGRAFGLLLRNEIDGQALDIRNEGLYGIGAEILLRQRGHRTTGESSGSLDRDEIATVGFERAKLYYERLMVQYPIHKTWPDAVNALDFCIALFSLWVHSVCQESRRLQGFIQDEVSTLDDSDQDLIETKHWEFEQAKRIAEAMDLRMRDVLFNGDPDLIRLRAMVALWTADLIELCTKLEASRGSARQSDTEQSEDILVNQVGRTATDTRQHSGSPSITGEASVNRNLAKSLLDKLQHLNPGHNTLGGT